MHQKYIQKQAKLPVLHKNALWLLRELAEAKCQKRDEAEELHFDSQNNISSIIETTNEYSRFMKRLSEKTKEIEQCIEMAENPKRLNLEPKLTYSISLINNIENTL